MSLAKIGKQTFWTEQRLESNEIIAVGMFVRLKSKGFGKVTALWSENSPSGKVGLFAELQLLQVPHPLLPYHGASALQLKEEYEDVFLSKVEKRVVVEELSVFRKRSDFQSDVFYIADFVTVEGVRLPEPPARIRPPPRAEKLQKWIAAHVTDKDVVELEKKPSILPADPPEPAAIVQTFKMASKNVVQATERNATSMPAKLPPPKGGKKGMVIDSDEEELQLMIEIGELPEKIDEEDEDARPSKRSSRDHIEDENPKPRKKAALDLEGSTKKKMLKKTTLKLETNEKEDVESLFAGINSKKDQKKDKFVKTPKFDFMKDDDEDEMYKYEDEDEEEDEDDFVQDDEDEEVDLPVDFVRLSEKEAFAMWLEFVYLCEAQRPSYAATLRANPSHVFHRAISMIEKKIKMSSETIGSGGHWDATARDMLCSWTEFREGRAVTASEKGACQLCSKTLAETLWKVRLCGTCYDNDKLWESWVFKVYPNRQEETMFVGISCLQRARMFHKLVHFKVHVLDVMQKEDTILSNTGGEYEGSDEETKDRLMAQIISNLSGKLFKEMQDLTGEALKMK